MCKTLATKRPFLSIVCMLDWILRVHNRYALPVFQMDIVRMFGENFSQDGKRKFEKLNEWIRSLVPKDRLLEMRLGEDG